MAMSLPKPRCAMPVCPQGATCIAAVSVLSLLEQRKPSVALTLSPPSPPDFSLSTCSGSLGFPHPTFIIHNKRALFLYWDCSSRTPVTFASALSPLPRAEWERRPELQAGLHPEAWVTECDENPALTAALWRAEQHSLLPLGQMWLKVYWISVSDFILRGLKFVKRDLP